MTNSRSKNITTKVTVNDAVFIIPAYNEGSSILKVIEDIPDIYKIVVVDDGSTDETSNQVSKTRAMLVRHPINLGQGAALQTGIDFALLDKSNMYFVTFDADGQHKVSDVRKMLKYIKSKNRISILLGSRFLGTTENITRMKKNVLKLATKFSNLSTGLKLTDTHNGLRVFNREVAESLKLQTADFTHASEIIERISEKKWSYEEYPVTIVYTDYSKRKGQSMINAINVAFDILFSRVVKR